MSCRKTFFWGGGLIIHCPLACLRSWLAIHKSAKASINLNSAVNEFSIEVFNPESNAIDTYLVPTSYNLHVRYLTFRVEIFSGKEDKLSNRVIQFGYTYTRKVAFESNFTIKLKTKVPSTKYPKTNMATRNQSYVLEMPF